MAAVRLANIYNPLVFEPAVQEMMLELNNFIRSGIVVPSDNASRIAMMPGNIADLPFYFGIGNPKIDGTNEPNYSSDDPARESQTRNISRGIQKCRTAYMNASWSVMDLAQEIAFQDPTQAIINRIGGYWATNSQTRLIASCLGILADNKANDNSDMLYNVAADAAGDPGDENKISDAAIINAAQTMGDHSMVITTIAIHSVLYAKLQLDNQIEYFRHSDNNMIFSTYMGKHLVIDDTLPVRAGTTNPNRMIFTSILFGMGAFEMGMGMPERPSEHWRNPDAGDGGGQDKLYSRMTELCHPRGFSFESASVTGTTPSYANLQDARNWNRVYEHRNNIPIAFLESNG